MKQSRRDLIDDLVGDLKPVHRPGSTLPATVGWVAMAGGYSIVMVLVTGTTRADSLVALVTSPRFSVEIAVGFVSVVLLANAALRLAIPEEGSWPNRAVPPLIAVCGWVGLVVVGLLFGPALPAALADLRPHCLMQGLIFGVPSFGLLLWYTRNLLPLRPRVSAAMAGAAAGAITATLMQVVCLYEPVHALEYHLSVMPILAVIGVAIGPHVLKRRTVVPRRSAASLH
jgi:hypothetical protein